MGKGGGQLLQNGLSLPVCLDGLLVVPEFSSDVSDAPVGFCCREAFLGTGAGFLSEALVIA
jgi:hypothetical protein